MSKKNCESEARKKIAASIGATPEEIYFTSGRADGHLKALKAVGADLLSFDVRVQTPRDKDGNSRPYQEYILLECNSASSMDNGTGEVSVCAQKYIDEIPKIIIRKAKQNGR